MHTTLARVPVSGFDRFLEVFASAGQAARLRHGSRGAEAFRDAARADTAWVLIDWHDRAAFERFLADPAVRETMRSGGATGAPTFHALERAGRFAA